MIPGLEHAVIAACIAYILHRIINKNKKALAQEARINRPLDQLEDWDDYLAKLCRISKLNAHDIMEIAAKESGLNFGKSRINQDFKTFIDTGHLPHYTVRFLKQGKAHLDEINEGPIPYVGEIPPGMF